MNNYFPKFFATTGRDEFSQENDQLFHDGIDIERARYYSTAQDVAISHRSWFAPNFEDTQIAYELPTNWKNTDKNRDIRVN